MEKAAAIAPRPTLGEAREITLSASNTTVDFTIRWLSSITVHGHFTDVHGTLRIPPEGLERACVEVEIAAGSIRTGIGLRDRHLRGRTFLDATHHPLITFRGQNPCRDGTDLRLDGVLHIRGVERPIDLRCVIAPPPSPAVHAFSRATGWTALKRSDYAVGSPLGRRSRDPRFRLIGDEVNVVVTVDALSLPYAHRNTLDGAGSPRQSSSP
jgi:polyisoprenoid-binding protein YceI